MTPDAYYWIAVAYASIAGLTSMSLCVKGYNAYRDNKYYPTDYVLHAYIYSSLPHSSL